MECSRQFLSQGASVKCCKFAIAQAEPRSKKAGSINMGRRRIVCYDEGSVPLPAEARLFMISSLLATRPSLASAAVLFPGALCCLRADSRVYSLSIPTIPARQQFWAP